ncbi:hypothetical protein FRC07_009372 [Ceratobasidium sp. 392]|nr:hypothetical protein FRC07_009372 [Ceratobasidium sp. 392]
MRTPARIITTVLFALATVSSSLIAVTGAPIDSPYSPAGWYSRAKELKNGPEYKVEASKVVFGVTRSTRLEPNDARGRALRVQKQDFSYFKNLTTYIPSLPVADTFQNLWSIKQARSDWPIDGAQITTSYGRYTISLYGHDGVSNELEYPVDDYTEVPPELNTFFSLAKKAREGEGDVVNADMVAQAKAVLQA